MNRVIRLTLIVVTAFVAFTALAGGVALILGSTIPAFSTVLVPPAAYLRGSPFESYVIPGTALILLVSAPHAVAAFASARRRSWAPAACALAGFACLIWIFVQMVYIPFSFLQAAYFGIGMLELGLVLLWLGIFSPVGAAAPHPQQHVQAMAM